MLHLCLIGRYRSADRRGSRGLTAADLLGREGAGRIVARGRVRWFSDEKGYGFTEIVKEAARGSGISRKTAWWSSRSSVSGPPKELLVGKAGRRSPGFLLLEEGHWAAQKN